MKAQTKALVASVVVIALALSAVSGVTYSWFSDTEEAKIDITTAKVDYDVAFTAEVAKGLATVDSTHSPTFAVSNLAAGANITIDAKITNNSSIKTVYKVVLTPTYSQPGEGSTGFTMYDFKNILVQTYADTTTDLTAELKNTWNVGNDGVFITAEFNDILIKDWTVIASGTDPGKVQVVITTPDSYGSDSGDSSDLPAKIQSIMKMNGTASPRDASTAGDGYVAWSAATERSGLSFTVKVIAVQGDYPYTVMTKENLGGTDVSAAFVPSNKIVKADSIETADTGTKTASNVTIDFSNVATYSGTVDESSETNADVIGTKVTAKVTGVSTDDSTVKVNLSLYKVVNETSTLITSPQFDKPVVITMTVPGAMTSPKITYNDEEDGKILSSTVNGSGDNATTTVVFSVDHFSEYVIKDGSIINNLAELKSAMAAGGSYKLGSDISDVSSYIEVTSDATLNLNGHSIAFTGNSAGFEYTAGFNVIGTTEDSKITAENEAMFGSQTTGSELYVNGGTYTANAPIVVSAGPMISDGGGFTFGVGGTVHIVEGSFEAPSEVIYSINGEVTIDGGKFTNTTAKDSVIYSLGAAVVINDGQFTGGKYPISIQSTLTAGTLVINDGEFNATITGAESGGYVTVIDIGANSKSTVGVNGGTFNFTANGDGIGYLFYRGTGAELNVVGGTYTMTNNTNGSATFTVAWIASGESSKIITGGTFNIDPTNFLVDGYEATEDSSKNTWTVSKKSTSG